MNTPAATLRSILLLLCCLAAAWVLWSGHFEPLLLGLGVFSCAATFVIVWRMGYFDQEVFALHLKPSVFTYWIWLLKEIVVSSLAVTKVVLHPKLPISTRVLELKASSPGPVGQVIFANSITLTPGTLTLDLHEGHLKVHALTDETAEGLLTGDMDRRVAKLGDR